MSSEEVTDATSVEIESEADTAPVVKSDAPLISKSDALLISKSDAPLISKSISKPSHAELTVASDPSIGSAKVELQVSKSISESAITSRSGELTLSKQQLTASKDSKLLVSSSRISSQAISENEEDEIGSQEIVEEEEDLVNFPYGKRYEEITPERLKQIALELNLIKLYWPEILPFDVDQRKHYPKSYVENNNKEKVLLWYTENFRRQYQYVYRDRKPLFLAAENECGLQKMVCTTIRPSTIRFPEFKTWEGCANFVADHLEYEPLEKPQLLSQTRC
ncbi:hypothetical protein C0J52_05964 [Blattella germanica]|nr:hypothetical protein C0J52_05964 [Blattella germanica]